MLRSNFSMKMPVVLLTSAMTVLLNSISEQPPLIEGDIIDDDDTRRKIEVERTGGAAYDALNRGKWPNGVVPYTFGSVGM